MTSNNHSSENNIEPTSKTMCIVQLTRLGDLVQTLQAAQDLKKHHPEIRLMLVARKQFGSPMNQLLNQTFDICHFIDTQKMFEHNNLKEVRGELKSFLDKVNSEDIAATVNLSFSRSASYLCSLIKSTHRLGNYFDINSNLIINDKWSQYIYSNVLGGPLNGFSLVDLFKNVLGVKKAPAETEEKNSNKETDNIVIHPFASLDKKRWKINKWTEVIYKTLKNNPDTTISIVGDKNNSEEAEKLVKNPLLQDFSSRINSLAGKTSIEELMEHVKNSSFFVGHDSLVGHIASLMNKTTLTISLGPVRPSETTPYGKNSYNLASRIKCFPCTIEEPCAHPQCHTDIPYQIVYSSIQQIIEDGKITKEYLEKNNSCFHLTSVNLYHSSFSSLGMQKLTNILDNEPTIDDIYRTFYRLAWLYMFEEVEEECSFPKLTQATYETLVNDLPGLQYLYELAEFGKKYSHYILEEIATDSPAIEKIQGYSSKIDEVDHLQSVVKNAHPRLAPIINFLTILKGNLKGNNVVELTESAYLAYSDGAIITSVIYELIEKTMSEYKINNSKRVPTTSI